ncbi:unnamed protein product [Psylliodes chrysocephalus]|uniref:Uncharacterized protein n=1 Tax=Psylliodes chrysocephalus TaxID=3402493 RepID=A0A9P0G8L2_9CUCU|nr:unnamed protein product [Psylliodes chrysocephala]
MPPIVIDGKTTNPKNLIQDIKAIAKGSFSIKHTNYTTVLFIDEKEDHEKVLANIKLDKMPYHTYTNNEDKSHAFVLRGLSEGTKIADIELDMEEQYEIKTRAIYKMKTKDRPLYLVITDPAITLDYLNRNARRVLYTRVVWDIRKSAKQIIQCHTCQENSSKATTSTKKTTTVAENNNKRSMPPIVIDGKTANHNVLIKDIQGLVKGDFSVKHTNYTTILFVDKKEDHANIITNMKNEKLPYHTYTARDDKTHAFVLRGLGDGTKINDLKENLEDDHEILAREIYQMRTKERPLFLIGTPYKSYVGAQKNDKADNPVSPMPTVGTCDSQLR